MIYLVGYDGRCYERTVLHNCLSIVSELYECMTTPQEDGLMSTAFDYIKHEDLQMSSKDTIHMRHNFKWVKN